MANENKNINNLVNHPDDDPTSEFEIPKAVRRDFLADDDSIEVDAKTFDIDEATSGPKASGDDARDMIREQSRTIDELRYEVEHLRNQQRGLREELKARTEISENVNAEIREERDKLSRAKKNLHRRNEEFRTLQSAVEKTNARAVDLTNSVEKLKKQSADDREEIDQLRQALVDKENEVESLQAKLLASCESVATTEKSSAADQSRIDELHAALGDARNEIDDLKLYIDGRKKDWSGLHTDLDGARTEIKRLAEELAKTSARFDEQALALQEKSAEVERLSALLDDRRKALKALQKDNRALERALHQDAEQELAACRRQIAQQSGQIASLEHTVEGLKNDNSRLERYSDALRHQIEDSRESQESFVATRHALETDLEATNSKLATTRTELDSERETRALLQEQVATLKREFENEVRQIRFELGTAQDSIVEQETINEQLASDLIDSKGFREALESELNELEKTYEKQQRKLNRELKYLRRDVEEYERKIKSKDKAIADLMKELAGRAVENTNEGELDSMLHKIDGFRKPARNDHDDDTQTERVARLLIGKADGRELRFPLFNDRLTIGRTAHNDIQLNMQYVSRRHAVVVTDGDVTRIIDWGSKNGVFVNEKRVTEKALETGDIVTIGTTDFRYEEKSKR